MIDLFTLWYGRLAHIGITMKRIIKYGLISCKLYNLYKSETCIKSKIIKKSFHSVEITSQLIELVQSDIFELHGMLTRGGNKYFITFIDDYSRYTYILSFKI